MIEYLDSHVIYENPRPHVHSRHGFFPHVTKLSSGELLALFVLAEAFESPDATTCICRSQDGGRTWRQQGPLYDKSALSYPTSDTMKATALRDGTLMAVGYRFFRDDPEQGIGIEETNGTADGEDLVAFSEDAGRSWTGPIVIQRSWPELLEISGPCIELRSGDLMAVAGIYKRPDGSNPSGQRGVVLRSPDKGRTWQDHAVFFSSSSGTITAWEPRICEMQNGRLAAILWAYDVASGRHLPNQIVESKDDGMTWSDPVDTGHMGQASNILWLGGDRLLTIHAHRREDPGLYVRLSEFTRAQWKPLEERVIWGGGMRPQTRVGQDMNSMFTSIRFGQPSLLHLGGDEFLATHWCIEDGQGKIRTHRLRVC